MCTSSPVVATVSSATAEACVPQRLTHVVREISAEKVMRVSVSALRNLMTRSARTAGLVGALDSLCLPVILVK